MLALYIHPATVISSGRFASAIALLSMVQYVAARNAARTPGIVANACRATLGKVKLIRGLIHAAVRW